MDYSSKKWGLKNFHQPSKQTQKKISSTKTAHKLICTIKKAGTEN